MKVAIYCNEAWEREYLKQALPSHDLVFLDETKDKDYTDPDVTCVCVFIKTHVDSALMDRFPTLRGVVTRSTGFDHVDLKEAHARNISVSNVPAYGENTVAEYAFAMLLALSRKTYESYERIREAGIFNTQGLSGFDLKGLKFGVIGTGHTGQHAIRMARGFDMSVIGFDVQEQKHLDTELSFMYVTFDDLLAQADVISLHAPYNSHTHHLFNADTFAKMKRGVHLINTARGGLIDTRALVSALENGTIAGAGLDVVEEEGLMGTNHVPLITDTEPDAEKLQILLANQYLIDHPRVLIMPHNAFNTREALERILDTTVENIEGVAQGTPMHTVTG
jgi:D-lactate dehydrogenase